MKEITKEQEMIRHQVILDTKKDLLQAKDIVHYLNYYGPDEEIEAIGLSVLVAINQIKVMECK